MSDLTRLIESRKAQPVASAPSKPAKFKAYMRKALPFVVTIVVSLLVLLAGWSLFQDVSVDPSPGPRNGVEDVCERASKKYSENLSHVFSRLAREVEEGKIKTREELAKAARAYTAEARADAFSVIDSLDNEMVPPKSFVGTDKDGKDFDLTAETADYLRRKAEGHKRAAK